MTIHCSRRLEEFIGDLGPRVGDPGPRTGDTESLLGNWNGHVFWVKKKRCLMIMNSKTYYCLLVVDVTRDQMRDLAATFRQRLTEQLAEDHKLSKRIGALVRRELRDIQLCETNKNGSVMRMIDQHRRWLHILVTSFPPGEYWYEESLTFMLNNTPGGVGLGEDFLPTKAMEELLKGVEVVEG